MSNFFTSSIGKKLVMSLAGLFLMTFLVVHLSANLCLLRSDDGEWFKIVVHFMSTNILIKIMEYVLFGGLFLHMIYGVILQIQNWMSRPKRYAKTHSSQTSFFSKYMIHTGAIIFVFLGLHFVNFYFVKFGLTDAPQGAFAVVDRHDFYHMALNLFSSNAYCIIYIAFMLFLGFHLNHAFQSAFQTLGLNHKKYTPIIKAFGFLYSLGIAIGFSMIPLYFMLFR